jgi:hypothetical protein
LASAKLIVNGPKRHPSNPELGIIRDPACRRLCRTRHNRRTAVRNLDRAGVPRSTAMAMVGHETESIYTRYAIQDESMLREGSAKLAAWTEAQAVKAQVKGQGQRFKLEAK